MQMGMMAVKKHLPCADLLEESQYHFGGSPLLPRHCHSIIGWKHITALVSCGVYPGPGQWYVSGDGGEHVVLGALTSAGYVDHRLPNLWQIIFEGHSRWRRSRHHRRSFKKRSVPLLQYSQWELIDYVDEFG